MGRGTYHPLSVSRRRALAGIAQARLKAGEKPLIGKDGKPYMIIYTRISGSRIRRHHYVLREGGFPRKPRQRRKKRKNKNSFIQFSF